MGYPVAAVLPDESDQEPLPDAFLAEHRVAARSLTGHQGVPEIAGRLAEAHSVFGRRAQVFQVAALSERPGAKARRPAAQVAVSQELGPSWTSGRRLSRTERRLVLSESRSTAAQRWRVRPAPRRDAEERRQALAPPRPAEALLKQRVARWLQQQTELGVQGHRPASRQLAEPRALPLRVQQGEQLAWPLPPSLWLPSPLPPQPLSPPNPENASAPARHDADRANSSGSSCP